MSPPEPPGAGSGPELKAGTRVRVHLAEPKRKVVGELVRASVDSLVLRPEEDRNRELTLSAAEVRAVDISRGRRSEKGRGAFLGLLGGTAGGFLAFMEICKEECVGAGIGAGIGSLIRSERWQQVSWP